MDAGAPAWMPPGGTSLDAASDASLRRAEVAATREMELTSRLQALQAKLKDVPRSPARPAPVPASPSAPKRVLWRIPVGWNANAAQLGIEVPYAASDSRFSSGAATPQTYTSPAPVPILPPRLAYDAENALQNSLQRAEQAHPMRPDEQLEIVASPGSDPGRSIVGSGSGGPQPLPPQMPPSSSSALVHALHAAAPCHPAPAVVAADPPSALAAAEARARRAESEARGLRRAMDIAAERLAAVGAGPTVSTTSVSASISRMLEERALEAEEAARRATEALSNAQALARAQERRLLAAREETRAARLESKQHSQEALSNAGLIAELEAQLAESEEAWQAERSALEDALTLERERLEDAAAASMAAEAKLRAAWDECREELETHAEDLRARVRELESREGTEVEGRRAAEAEARDLRAQLASAASKLQTLEQELDSRSKEATTLLDAERSASLCAAQQLAASERAALAAREEALAARRLAADAARDAQAEREARLEMERKMRQMESKLGEAKRRAKAAERAAERAESRALGAERRAALEAVGPSTGRVARTASGRRPRRTYGDAEEEVNEEESEACDATPADRRRRRSGWAAQAPLPPQLSPTSAASRLLDLSSAAFPGGPFENAAHLDAALLRAARLGRGASASQGAERPGGSSVSAGTGPSQTPAGTSRHGVGDGLSALDCGDVLGRAAYGAQSASSRRFEASLSGPLGASESYPSRRPFDVDGGVAGLAASFADARISEAAHLSDAIGPSSASLILACSPARASSPQSRSPGSRAAGSRSPALGARPRGASRASVHASPARSTTIRATALEAAFDNALRDFEASWVAPLRDRGSGSISQGGRVGCRGSVASTPYASPAASPPRQARFSPSAALVASKREPQGSPHRRCRGEASWWRNPIAERRANDEEEEDDDDDGSDRYDEPEGRGLDEDGDLESGEEGGRDGRRGWRGKRRSPQRRPQGKSSSRDLGRRPERSRSSRQDLEASDRVRSETEGSAAADAPPATPHGSAVVLGARPESLFDLTPRGAAGALRGAPSAAAARTARGPEADRSAVAERATPATEAAPAAEDATQGFAHSGFPPLSRVSSSSSAARAAIATRGDAAGGAPRPADSLTPAGSTTRGELPAGPIPTSVTQVLAPHREGEWIEAPTTGWLGLLNGGLPDETA